MNVEHVVSFQVNIVVYDSLEFLRPPMRLVARMPPFILCMSTSFRLLPTPINRKVYYFIYSSILYSLCGVCILIVLLCLLVGLIGL